MSFRRLHLSFTERRRRRLAKKVDQLDRLEITEHHHRTHQFHRAWRIACDSGVLARLGIMYPDGANHAPSGLTRAEDAAKQCRPVQLAKP